LNIALTETYLKSLRSAIDSLYRDEGLKNINAKVVKLFSGFISVVQKLQFSNNYRLKTAKGSTFCKTGTDKSATTNQAAEKSNQSTAHPDRMTSAIDLKITII
jgi:hypothetical protein